jgi:murein DD-endopeptidase MepM/ murein hydrolase activator NlpD
MNGKHNAFRTSVLFASAIVLGSFASAFAQRLPLPQATQLSRGSHARVETKGARVGTRRLVKIRARAGDTLSLLGDRFGASAEEIANLNGISVGSQLRPGQEILIPLPSPEMLARPVADSSPRDTSVEAEGEWVNVQGVLFRKGSTTRTVEPSRANSDVADGKEDREKGAATLAKVVDVGEAERSNAAQPVWIYLVGGARVEADSVNETAEGVWYTHGLLTIFIERSRVERIERERAASVSDSSGSWTERGWTTGNAKFDALIKESGARFGVDPYLIFCVMEQESQFKPWVVSPKGARGLMQLMPGTAARFGVRKPFDPAENIRGGTLYLKQLLENFGGRVDLVLAGYNAGEGAVMRFGGNVPPYRETRNYVQRISKRYGQSRSFVADAKGAASAPSGLR